MLAVYLAKLEPKLAQAIIQNYRREGDKIMHIYFETPRKHRSFANIEAKFYLRNQHGRQKKSVKHRSRDCKM